MRRNETASPHVWGEFAQAPRTKAQYQLGVRSAVWTLARDGLRLLEALVLVYINSHGRAFTWQCSPAANCSCICGTRAIRGGRPQIAPAFAALAPSLASRVALVESFVTYAVRLIGILALAPLQILGVIRVIALE